MGRISAAFQDKNFKLILTGGANQQTTNSFVIAYPPLRTLAGILCLFTMELPVKDIF